MKDAKTDLSAPALQALSHEISQLVHGAVAQALRDAAAADTALPALRVPRAHTAEGVRALAALHPGGAGARREATALYTRCLQHYRQKVQPTLERQRAQSPQSGVPQDDLGVAAAYFVLANVAACQGLDPDPQALPAVERQLGGLLRQTTAWQRLSVTEQQSMFEQLALLGVLVNESRLVAQQNGPEARAHLAAAARGYLQQLLGLVPERLSVSVQGLAVDVQVH